MSNTTLRLKFWDRNLIHANGLPSRIVQSENRYKLYEFQNDILYQLRIMSGSFLTVHTNADKDYRLNQLRHVFSINETQDLFIVNVQQGIRMYLCDDADVSKIYDSNITKLWTHIFFDRFYNDPNEMGAMAISTGDPPQFFKITENYNFTEVATNVDAFDTICTNVSKITIGNLRKEPKPALIGRDEVGLCVFDFDADKKIQYVLKIVFAREHGISQNDEIFFANLTGQDDWMDVVVFNSKGMFLFANRDNPANIYELINFNPMFSEIKGWTAKHTETVQFTDIDNDGFDDLIFIGTGGIEILSYNVLKNTWISILRTETLSPLQRYASVLHVFRPIAGLTDKTILITYHSNNIYLADIVECPAESFEMYPINRKFQENLHGSKVVFESLTPKKKDARSTIYLRDQKIFLGKGESINPQTGKPQFVVPLLDDTESIIKFHLFYDGSSYANEPLGYGWSTPQTFIVSNYEDGNFEEDESYVLIVDNTPYKLNLLFTNSTVDLVVFEFEKSGTGKAYANYFPSTSTWYIDYGNNRNQLFGNYGEQYGAIISDTAWNNWRGRGFDENSTTERANMWYLATSETKGIITFYQYETIRNPELEGKNSYNAGVFLKHVHNIFSEIIFFYNASPMRLSNYTYKTKTTQQTVHFNHSIIEDHFLLMAIEQENDYIAQPVMEFTYCEPVKGKYALEKMVLPTGTQIIYNYSLLGTRSSINETFGRKLIVSDDYKVSYGSGFTLISYVDRQLQKVSLRMFNTDVSEEIKLLLNNKSSTKVSWPSLGENAIAHEILVGDSFLAAIVYNSVRKFVYLFGRRTDGGWVSPPHFYNYSDEATVLKGNNFILVSDPYNANVYMNQWLSSEHKWDTSPMSVGVLSHRAIAVHRNKFLIYDNQNIFLGYKSPIDTKKWHFKKLVYTPGYLSQTNTVLNKFDLNAKFKKALLASFLNNALQFHHNLIVLTALAIQDEKEFYTKIKMFVIGRNHKIASVSYDTVRQDMFSELESEPESNSDGDIFTLKYAYEENKLKLILGSLESPHGKTRAQLSEQIGSAMNSPAQRFLLNLENYLVRMRGQTLECRNVKFTYGGNEWHRSEIRKNENFKDSQSVILGNRFTVNKTDADSTVKLYDASTNQELFDFRVKELKRVQINYPIYIASQGKGEPIVVIEFNNGKETYFQNGTLPKSNRIQKLSPFGNALLLITDETEFDWLDWVENKTLTIWSIYGIRRFLPDYVISSAKLVLPGPSGGSKERITGYEYEAMHAQLMANVIHYNQMTLVPGNKKASYGYIIASAKYVKFFNGEDEMVKIIEKETNQTSDAPENVADPRKETILYCRYGHYKIADFAPYSRTSDMNGFIGFEDYEKSSSKWIFEKNDIVKNGFSLTGRNYLLLRNASSLKGIFRPQFQDRHFVASSWIRTPIENIPELGDVLPYLTAVVFSTELNKKLHLLSDVKYQIDDWTYLEVGFDLEFIKVSLQKALSKNVEVEIRVSSSPLVSLEVDHIRFSTMNKVFDVNVFDQEINRPVAIIKANGAITRRVYDKYQVQIADINESNQIGEFTTYTKRSYYKNTFKNPSSLVMITPQKGFYEQFSPVCFCRRWTLTNKNYWNISVHTLSHNSSDKSQLTLNSEDISIGSHGIRFLYTLSDSSSIKVSDLLELNGRNDKAEISLIDNKFTKQKVPIEGEFLLVREEKRIIVWVDGGLYIDQSLDYSNSISIDVEGEVELQHMMVFDTPQVHLTYKNALDEEIQQISLTSASTAIVRQKLYDDLGRQRINVQAVEISRFENQSLVEYAANLVTNYDPIALDSVWRTQKLEGEIQKIVGHDYAFSEIIYDNNPLSVERRIGMPGKEFSTYGKYAYRYRSTTSNMFLRNMYPVSENFTYKAQIGSDGSERISVFDKSNLKVAMFIDVKDGRDVFSTFEYNKNGSLTKSRSPMFYYKFGIFDQTTLDLNGILQSASDNDPLVIRIEYDNRGNPKNKTSPDIGPLENVYDDQNQLRFIVHHLRDSPKSIESITYLNYDDFGRLISTGSLRLPCEKTHLLSLNISKENANEFQRFYYGDIECEPAFRNKILRTITMNGNEALHEESIHDFDDNLISKRYITPNGSKNPLILSINKRFEGGLLKEIIYPATMFGAIFRVSYEYDKIGRMVSVGMPGQSERFVWIKYDANNQITAMVFLPLKTNGFAQSYSYNDPGYLTEIKNKYFSQSISYTDTDHGYGGVKVTRVKYTAEWHDLCNRKEIGVHEESFQNNVISLLDSQRCFHELKREGYLNTNNQQTRIFDPNLNAALSFYCTNGTIKRRVKEVLGKYGFPQEYGFRFSYGHYDELKIAKYFVGTNEPNELSINVFAKNIKKIDANQSQQIWNLLKSSGYIVEDDDGKNKKLGKSFLRESLVDDIKSVNPELERFVPLIKKLLLKQFATRQSDISLDDIGKIFGEGYPNKTAYSKAILESLSSNGYFEQSIKPHFSKSLKHFASFAPEILGTLLNYQFKERSEFDMESNEIDLNGNHIEFIVGFEKYHLHYETNSNRISQIMKTTTSYPVHHDNRGNVVKALHKKIESMEYHPISNRLQKARMTNGYLITFQYDSKGERVRKRVTDKKGKPKLEMQYLRDEKGRTLVEKQTTYVVENQEPDLLVTVYIYGPKTLIGFVRRDHFYSVITDHQGSIRLIVREGEIVAAYDYMPYGSIMRVYGGNPDAHIPYRYTGQEWDSELGLYNFHSRFYDPIIGRFYQIDPMTQYFSPYKYAGNSPALMVDLSGSIAGLFILAVIGFTLLGAYLGGAASNNDYNFLNWDWSKRETQVAIFIGGVTGALLPVGFSGSLAALSFFSLSAIQAATVTTSIGLLTAYMSMGASSGDWNPGNWDYASPKTWYASFEGFSVGVGIISGFNGAHSTFISLSRIGKLIFGAAVSIYAGQALYIAGKSTDWRIERPEFWYSSMTHIVSAADLPMFGVNAFRFVQNNSKKLLENLRQIELLSRRIMKTLPYGSVPAHIINQISLKTLRSIETGGKLLLGSASFLIALSTIVSLIMGDFQNWDLTQFQTYHDFLAAAKLTANTFDAAKVAVYVTKPTSTKRAHAIAIKTTRSFTNTISDVIVKNKDSIFYGSTVVITNSNLALLVKVSNITIVYTRDRFTYPICIEDTAPSTQSITFTNNSFLVQNVANAIANGQIAFENITKGRIIQEIWHIRSPNGKQNLEKFLQFDRNHIASTLSEMNIQSKQSAFFSQRYLRKTEKLKLSNNDISFSEENRQMKIIQYLEIAMKNLKWKENAANALEIETLTEFLWGKVMEYEKSIETWQISNCAEPTFKMNSNPESEPRSHKYFPNPNSYESSKNLTFLSSYKLEDIPDLAVFQKCYNCINATSQTRTKVRDIIWLSLLNDEFIQPDDVEERKLVAKISKRSIGATDLNLNAIEKQLPEGLKKSFFDRVQSETHPNSSWSIIEMGDKFFSQISTNGTLLLADILVAKCRNRKIYKPTKITQKLNHLQKQELACTIVEIYNEYLLAAAEACEIEFERLDRSNIYELYETVTHIATTRSFEKLYNLLVDYALEVSADIRKYSRCNHNRFESFLKKFNFPSKIDAVLIKMNEK